MWPEDNFREINKHNLLDLKEKYICSHSCALTVGYYCGIFLTCNEKGNLNNISPSITYNFNYSIHSRDIQFRRIHANSGADKDAVKKNIASFIQNGVEWRLIQNGQKWKHKISLKQGNVF